jgi:hypothetical protein
LKLLVITAEQNDCGVWDDALNLFLDPAWLAPKGLSKTFGNQRFAQPGLVARWINPSR